MFEGTIVFYGEDDGLTIDFGWNTEPICLSRDEAYRFFHEVGEAFHAVHVTDDHGMPIERFIHQEMQIGDVVLGTEAMELFLERFSVSLERMERRVLRESPPPPLEVGGDSRHSTGHRVDWINEGF